MRATPKLIRLLVICLIITTTFTVHLVVGKQSQHHAAFEPPDSGTVVHGKQVNKVAKALYPLHPFPESPMQVSLSDDDHNHTSSQPPKPWLAAVICAAADFEHRAAIRSTWMQLFRDVPFDGRFVVANPGPQWTAMVAMENRTFGDIIVLDHLQEDDVTANTVKTLEFYKWLVSHDYRYEFVSKMDTDLWLNARGFWDKFLAPRLSNKTGVWKSTVERTVIGELYYTRSWDLVFPHGSMYTVTWDMVGLLSSLQSRFKVVTGEDMALAVLMLKGRERANFVNFRGTEKFDYDDRDSRGDGTAWSRASTHPNSTRHALYGTDPIAIHELKDSKLWRKVADCFDETGLKKAPEPLGPDRTPFSVHWFDFWDFVGFGHRHRSRFDGIPDFLWSFQDGSWICDDIWNLGKTKTGYSAA
ncbi:uncharacterized protein DNG_09559 [Cephalotrichum gorgonifer]|uniref:Hexosyltransferase n=1 Tax=Cephalotrichum gorgonifer TaxID=2041049 RepID=A0AAE8N8J6_9PEZI|nr:uncharacterized protein DNG_09559 [Cephalotrichum gorgonifer]